MELSKWAHFVQDLLLTPMCSLSGAGVSWVYSLSSPLFISYGVTEGRLGSKKRIIIPLWGETPISGTEDVESPIMINQISYNYLKHLKTVMQESMESALASTGG